MFLKSRGLATSFAKPRRRGTFQHGIAPFCYNCGMAKGDGSRDPVGEAFRRLSKDAQSKGVRSALLSAISR